MESLLKEYPKFSSVKPLRPIRAFQASVWFCCALLMLAVAVPEGWAASDADWAPFRVCSYPEGFSEEDLDDSIVVAVAGPLRTEKGQEMLRGSNLRIEEVNRLGGIGGKEIVLLQCDDGVDPGSAGSERENSKKKRWQAVANRIADSEALVVIGHRSSNASIAAGGIYWERRIPAITGTALADEITEKNEWYFRTVPQTSKYMESIVHYANKVLGYRKFTIIHASSPFEQRLRKSFVDSLRNDGMEKVGEWGLPTDERKWDREIARILQELDASNPDAVFLAIDDENVLPVLRAIKENGMDIPILGGAVLSKTSFPLLFEGLPREKQKPGYYTDGILAPAYFMFDIAGKSTDKFKRAYEERFPGHEPDAGAISTYDATGLAIEAIEETHALGNNKEKRRANIRDYISGFHKNTGDFYEGAMGNIFFDGEGNAITDVPIAFLLNRQIISAPIQMAEISDPKELDRLGRRVLDGRFDEKKGHVFKIDSKDKTKFFNRVNAVYSGVRINGISDIDAEALTYFLDAYLWFRFDEDPELDRIKLNREGKPAEEYLGNIEFLNAIGDVDVIEEESVEPGPRMGELGYSLYRVKGRFRARFNPESYARGESTLELNFRHRTLPRERLIFVQDILGIYEPQKDSPDAKKIESQILSPATGWEIRKITYHLDTMDAPTLGNPELFGKRSDEVEFSRYNSNITIGEIGIAIMGVFFSNFLLHLLALIVITTILLILYIRYRKYSARSWFSNPILYIVFFISTGLAILNWNTESMNLIYLDFITKTMDISWWIVLGMILSFSTKIFIFAPLEEKTGRKIPTIIPRMTGLTIYILMLFGITAFVLDYKVTSLLATSGVLAMIIGLAIQTNLSNIFSGIAINLEHPFRIGDLVKIGDFDEGKVINVTWRSVRIRTPDNHIIYIPNSIAAESITHNFTPSLEGRDSIRVKDKKFILSFTVDVCPEEEPSKIKRILEEAIEKIARENQGILLEPEPVIKFLGIREHSAGGYVAQYEVMVSIEDYKKKKAYSDQLWDGIWNQLSKAGCLRSAFAG